jgi:hypothetical protein
MSLSPPWKYLLASMSRFLIGTFPLPVVVCAVLAGCQQESVRERPEWAFGVESVRRDPLPPELDTLKAWGDYYDGAAPVAYAVDLNEDGEQEYLVRADSAQCGPYGGCPTKLIFRSNGGYVDVLDALAEYVYVTNHRVNRWPVLWVSVRGIDGGLFRFVFDGKSYQAAETLRNTRQLRERDPDGEMVGRDSLSDMLDNVPTR